MRCVFPDSISGDLMIDVNGEALLLDASGAALAVRHDTLIFSDLHFEKGSSYAASRQFLPPYDTRATLERMMRAVKRHRPARVIALGDSFHDAGAAGRLGHEERAVLEAIAGMTHFVWIAGNHDPRPPIWLGGEIADTLRMGGLVFRHGPLAGV